MYITSCEISLSDAYTSTMHILWMMRDQQAKKASDGLVTSHKIFSLWSIELKFCLDKIKASIFFLLISGIQFFKYINSEVTDSVPRKFSIDYQDKFENVHSRQSKSSTFKFFISLEENILQCTIIENQSIAIYLRDYMSTLPLHCNLGAN